MVSKEEVFDFNFFNMLLEYEPITGKLFWRERYKGMFKDYPIKGLIDKDYWNKKNAFKVAFDTVDTNGYLCGGICRIKFRAHRLIWLLNYGEWPNKVDHIDGDRANNKLSNLQNGDQSFNMKNAYKSTVNTSGITGVRQRKDTGKWIVRLYVDGKEKGFGCYETKELAESVLMEAREQYGYGSHHGKTKPDFYNYVK